MTETAIHPEEWADDPSRDADADAWLSQNLEPAPSTSNGHAPVIQLAAAVETADSWQPVNLTTLPDRPPVQPTLGSARIVYPGHRHVFSGPPESAKTLAAYIVAIEILRADEHATVVLIDFEMGAYTARDRLHELQASAGELARIHYLEPDTPATPDRVQALAQLHPTLVIVDAAAGAYDLQGLDDNKRSDVEKLSRLYVNTFWRAGIATILIDHVTKNAETRGRFTIGSERKLGSADVHLGYEPLRPINRGTTGLYKIVTHKDRGGWLQRGHLANLELASDPGTHAISWTFAPATHTPEDAPFRPTVLMERVSAYLQLSTEALSFNQIAGGVKGHNDKAKRDAIEALIREGYATEHAGPRNARLVTHRTTYKQETLTSADLGAPLPAEVTTTSADHVPPYRGRAEVEAEDNDLTSADDDIPF